jgi:PKD repeat protein
MFRCLLAIGFVVVLFAPPVACDSPESTATPTPTPRVNADFTGEKTVTTSRTWVQFTDLSTGPVVSWEWDVDGDGKVDSTDREPKAVYRRNGLYTVTLTVRGSEEWDVDIITKEDYVEVTGCQT